MFRELHNQSFPLKVIGFGENFFNLFIWNTYVFSFSFFFLYFNALGYKDTSIALSKAVDKLYGYTHCQVANYGQLLETDGMVYVVFSRFSPDNSENPEKLAHEIQGLFHFIF